MIDIDPKDYMIVKDILERELPNYEIWAYGSRVKGTAQKFSDLDLVVITTHKLDWRTLEQVKDQFSASNLTIMVDISDWSTLDDTFKHIIQANYAVIQAAQSSKD